VGRCHNPAAAAAIAGGGLLGIAHVGFVCVLEEAGVRFRGIGGTSAGAINAIVIAATRDNPEHKSWKKTLQAYGLANCSVIAGQTAAACVFLQVGNISPW
jgi:predicted acylesterase/phospholipase RssA